jgi:hypothetical protein
MTRKPRFPPEPDTRPDARRSKRPSAHRSGPAPKDARARSEAPTLPPPGKSAPKGSSRPARSGPVPRDSSVQKVKPDMPAATVDEVTADLSRDPRAEQDEDEDS